MYMVGRRRQDRSTIRNIVVVCRFPKAVVKLLDALVLQASKQTRKLGGRASRTSLLETLIVGHAERAGLLTDSTVAPDSTTGSRSPEPSPSRRKQRGPGAYDLLAHNPIWDEPTKRPGERRQSTSKRPTRSRSTARNKRGQ